MHAQQQQNNSQLLSRPRAHALTTQQHCQDLPSPLSLCTQAYVSRTEYPEWAIPCLKLFDIVDGVTAHDLAPYQVITRRYQLITVPHCKCIYHITVPHCKCIHHIMVPHAS